MRALVRDGHLHVPCIPCMFRVRARARARVRVRIRVRVRVRVSGHLHDELYGEGQHDEGYAQCHE